MRVLLFLVAFLVALVASAPLERWILPLVQGPLAQAGLELRVDGLRFALPMGLLATGLDLEGNGGGGDIDSLYVGAGRTFDAKACGGEVSGSFTAHSLSLDLDRVNPALCLRIGKLSLETSLSGSVVVDAIDLLDPRPSRDTEGRIELSAPAGIFRGILEHAGRGGEDIPLGEWEFNDLVLKAHFSKGRLAIDEGRTSTSGVEWEVLSIELPGPGDARGGLRVDFRARAATDGPRAKALLGLMPKAAIDASGWRNYRVVGSLSAPRVVGVD